MRALIVGALVVVASGESLAYGFGDIPVWSYSQTPSAYQDLGDDPDVDMVAVYPLSSPADDPDKLMFSFQPELDAALVNPVADTTDPDDPSDVARGMGSLLDPQTIPALRSLGTDRIVVERDRLGAPPPAAELATMGLELVRSYSYEVDDAPNQRGAAPRWAYLSPYYNLDVYRVLDGPVGDAVVALGAGWHPFERSGWGGSRWMTAAGQLTVVPLTPGTDRARVSFRASAFGVDRVVEVRDGDSVVATLDVSAQGGVVSFEAPTGRPLDLVAVGGASPVSEFIPDSTDTRLLSIFVGELEVSSVGG